MRYYSIQSARCPLSPAREHGQAMGSPSWSVGSTSAPSSNSSSIVDSWVCLGLCPSWFLMENRRVNVLMPGHSVPRDPCLPPPAAHRAARTTGHRRTNVQNACQQSGCHSNRRINTKRSYYFRIPRLGLATARPCLRSKEYHRQLSPIDGLSTSPLTGGKKIGNCRTLIIC